MLACFTLGSACRRRLFLHGPNTPQSLSTVLTALQVVADDPSSPPSRARVAVQRCQRRRRVACHSFVRRLRDSFASLRVNAPDFVTKMRLTLVLTLPCVAQALRVPGPGRMPPQKPINHHLPGAVAEPRPDAIQQLRRNDFGDLHAFLKSFESCATLADALEPLALPQVDYVVDQAVKPPSTLADTGACLQLMAEGDFLGAHDVCEGLLEKGAGQGDAARSTAFSIISALCEGELTGTYDLAFLDRLDDNVINDPRARRSSTSDERSRRRPRRPWATRWRRRRTRRSRRWRRKHARRADSEISVVVDEEEVYDEVVEEELPPKALTALDELVAIKPAKALFAALTDAALLAEERQDDLRETSFSCVFSGNPGTGKSTVMKLYGSLLEELKVAPQGKTVETTGGELARGGTDGFEALVKESFADPQTSILQVGDKVEVKRGASWGNFGEVVFVDKNTYDVRHGDCVEIKAPRHRIRDKREEGGVLLVDEAHQLDPSNSNAGRQVLEMLVKEMDSRQGSLTVVFAGPAKEMDLFLSSTPGLSSRVRRTVDFPDFSDDELVEVSQRKFASRFGNYQLADEKYLRIAARRLGKGRGAPGFGNARAVSHLIDNAWEKQTRRVAQERQRSETRTRSTSRAKIC